MDTALRKFCRPSWMTESLMFRYTSGGQKYSLHALTNSRMPSADRAEGQLAGASR